jgi:hypothetical protein
MPCDSCLEPLGSNARRYTPAQLLRALETGYRPSGVVPLNRAFGELLGQDPDIFWDAWIEHLRSDRTDWLLCRPCWTEFEAAMS